MFTTLKFLFPVSLKLLYSLNYTMFDYIEQADFGLEKEKDPIFLLQIHSIIFLLICQCFLKFFENVFRLKKERKKFTE